MSKLTLRFQNCTSSVIKFSSPDEKNMPMMPGARIEHTAQYGDYSITYNGKDYPIERRYINMLAPANMYDIKITDSITVLDPVSNSLYTCVNRSVELDDNKSVILSLEQNIMLTNGTSDGEWIEIPNSNKWKIIVAMLLLVLLFVILTVLMVYLYKKSRIVS